jgi:acetylornithine/N-succinyldiaminopimelate aminotransferase
LALGREIGPKVVDAALAQGLLINSPRPTTLRFVPALNVTRAEIDQMTAILREAIQSVTNS